jgi:hypothetical protein
MAGRLTARKVATAKVGKYSDGNNLYLVVSHSGSRKWVLRFTWRGRAKEMGLGSALSVPLSSAREKAAIAVRALEAGQNPIAERKRTGGIPLSVSWQTRSLPRCRSDSEIRSTERSGPRHSPPTPPRSRPCP